MTSPWSLFMQQCWRYIPVPGWAQLNQAKFLGLFPQWHPSETKKKSKTSWTGFSYACATVGGKDMTWRPVISGRIVIVCVCVPPTLEDWDQRLVRQPGQWPLSLSRRWVRENYDLAKTDICRYTGRIKWAHFGNWTTHQEKWRTREV